MKFFFRNSLVLDHYLILPFLLLPFFLISGPFLPDLLMSSSALIFLIYCVRNKYFNFFNNYYFLLFFIIYIYININSLFSFDPLISFKTSIPYIRVIIFALCFSFIAKKKNFTQLFFYSFFSSYIILLIDSLIQLKTGFNVIGYPATSRISSFFGEELIMGSFVARTLPFVLGIYFYLDIRHKEFLALVLLLVSGILVFLSGERLSFALYIITAFFFSIFFFNLKFKIYFLVLIFFIFSLISIYNPNSFNRLYYQTKNQLMEGENVLSISYRHQLHYLSAYKMFKDKKFLGHGIRSFRNLCSEENYNLQDKINKDFIKISPIDGFYNIKKIYKKLEGQWYEYQLISVSSNKDHVEFEVGDTYIKLYKTEGEYVKKNDPLFSNYGYSNGCNTHPHNIYLQMLAEIGIVGALLFFSFFIFMFAQLIIIFLRIIKNNKAYKNQSNFFFILGVVLSLFPLFPSGSFYNNWLLTIFGIKLGFLINYYPLILKKND